MFIHRCCVSCLLRVRKASPTAHWVKNLPAVQEKQGRRFSSWGEKIAWRRKWQSTPVFLPGKSHGQGSLVGYSPWGCKESDTTEHAQDTQLVRGHIYIWTPILIFQTLSYFFYTPLPEENKNQYRACVSSTYQGKIQDVSKHLASGRKNNR